MLHARGSPGDSRKQWAHAESMGRLADTMPSLLSEACGWVLKSFRYAAQGLTNAANTTIQVVLLQALQELNATTGDFYLYMLLQVRQETGTVEGISSIGRISSESG